ncbi:uncharacterized protein LOC120426008 isoform X1 [Culex pipiens pallens]|uniref:uncharacterized protein LOC120426008 isoform X1 n=1 Tax=Culex pipiens pallens TaxID=42434 RepID=UPI001953C106|nr:uncharacterized protein LOC120426008 isoform X1 [Culex pipiens pallens]
MSTARNCTVSSANNFTDPTDGGDSGDLFQADGLLVEVTPLKSILEVKFGGQPPGRAELLAVRESAQGTCKLVARRWKSATSTTRARCTGLSTSIRVAPPPTSPSMRRTCTIFTENIVAAVQATKTLASRAATSAFRPRHLLLLLLAPGLTSRGVTCQRLHRRPSVTCSPADIQDDQIRTIDD